MPNKKDLDKREQIPRSFPSSSEHQPAYSAGFPNKQQELSKNA